MNGEVTVNIEIGGNDFVGALCDGVRSPKFIFDFLNGTESEASDRLCAVLTFNIPAFDNAASALWGEVVSIGMV